MRAQLPEHKKLVLETVMPIRWGDMDAYGHVNNTVYFRYMESARVEWLDSLDPSQAPPDQGIVIANAFCNFLAELRYPGDLRVRMFVANPGRSSFDTFYELTRTDDSGTPYANGGAKAVWVDRVARKSAPLPPALRALLELPATSA